MLWLFHGVMINIALAKWELVLATTNTARKTWTLALSTPVLSLICIFTASSFTVRRRGCLEADKLKFRRCCLYLGTHLRFEGWKLCNTLCFSLNVLRNALEKKHFLRFVPPISTLPARQLHSCNRLIDSHLGGVVVGVGFKWKCGNVAAAWEDI